jgi:DNA adenine methylase
MGKDRRVRDDELRNMPLRYPGGKQRFLAQIGSMLPNASKFQGRFIEPFVGGGAVFFCSGFQNAVLADINDELIDLYRAVRYAPRCVWKEFKQFPATKKAYYEIRDQDISSKGLVFRAARTLFLNRTCFKGMWRHNASGRFNVGYGGQSRRWVISETDLLAVAKRLRCAALKTADFEEIINVAGRDDFLFVDPPYRPGKREMFKQHYVNFQFTFADHERLADSLRTAKRRGAQWLLTTSAHRDIRELYKSYTMLPLSKGAGNLPGIRRKRSRELLVSSTSKLRK